MNARAPKLQEQVKTKGEEGGGDEFEKQERIPLQQRSARRMKWDDLPGTIEIEEHLGVALVTLEGIDRRGAQENGGEPGRQIWIDTDRIFGGVKMGRLETLDLAIG